MAAVRQILPHQAVKCVRSELDERLLSSQQVPSSPFLDLIAVVHAQLDLLSLSLKESYLLMLTCKRAYATSLDSTFWLARIGYELRKPAPQLCPFRVFLHLNESVGTTFRSDQLVCSNLKAPRPSRDSANKLLEVVFILDITGSMGAQLEGVKAMVAEFCRNNRDSADSRGGVRIHIYTYTESSVGCFVSRSPKGLSASELISYIKNLQLSTPPDHPNVQACGDDGPENVVAAVSALLDSFSSTDNLLAFLVTDAAPHHQAYGASPTAKKEIEWLQKQRPSESVDVFRRLSLVVESLNVTFVPILYSDAQRFTWYQQAAVLTDGVVLCPRAIETNDLAAGLLAIVNAMQTMTVTGSISQVPEVAAACSAFNVAMLERDTFQLIEKDVKAAEIDRRQLIAEGPRMLFIALGGLFETTLDKFAGKLQQRGGPGKVKLKPLVVHTTNENLVDFMLNNFKNQIKLKNFPTQVQATEVEFTISSLLDGGVSVDKVVDTCLACNKANKVLLCVVAAALLQRNRSRPEDKLDMQPLAKLLQSVDAILDTCAMMKGRKVTELQVTPSKCAYCKQRGCWITDCEVLKQKKRTGGRAPKPQQLEPLKGNYPQALKRAIVRALGGMSWMQLNQAFSKAKRGRILALFKNMHIQSVIAAEREALEKRAAAEGGAPETKGLDRVFLLQAMLREQRYPASAADFADSEWERFIVRPLRQMCTDALFDANPLWLRREWQSELAHAPLQRPLCNALPCVLARDGNCPASWHQLLRLASKGVVTPPQILAHVRDLAMLDVDAEAPGAFLKDAMARRKGGWVPLLKALTALEQSLSSARVAEVEEEVRQARAQQAAREEADSAADEAGEVVAGAQEEVEVKEEEEAKEEGAKAGEQRSIGVEGVQWGPGAAATEEMARGGGRGGRRAAGARVRHVAGKRESEAWAGVRLPVTKVYKDKKGTTKSVQKFKAVAPSFGQSSVDKFSAMLRSVLGDALDSAVTAARREKEGVDGSVAEEGAVEQAGTEPETADAKERVAVVLRTKELQLNVVRSGLPPVVPSFAETVLWRNEAIALSQLVEGEEPEKLLVGVWWRRSAGTDGRFKVLDLSMLIFDAEWNFISDCSWEHLRAGGCRHSGDWYGQAGGGADAAVRESIEVDMKAVRKAHCTPDADWASSPPKTAKYLVACVSAYGSRGLAGFPDAAVYLANPSQHGSGPGGSAVLAAQSLSGGGENGKAYVGLFIELCDDGDAVAVNVDHTLSGSSESEFAPKAAATAVAKECQQVQAVRQEGVALSSLACLLAAATSDKVCIVHGGERAAVASDAADGSAAIQAPPEEGLSDAAAWARQLAAASAQAEKAAAPCEPAEGNNVTCNVTCLQRKDAERSVDFARRVQGAADGLEVVAQPRVDDVKGALTGGEDVVVLCGELDNPFEVHAQLTEGSGGFGGRVTVANVRGHEVKTEEVTALRDESKTFSLVAGWDVLDLIA